MSLVWTSTKLPKKRSDVPIKRKKNEMHAALVAANEDYIITKPPIFAVLDGHGGQRVGIEARRLLYAKLSNKKWRKNKETEEKALKRIFKEIDKELYANVREHVLNGVGTEQLKPWKSGSTCTVVKIAENGKELLCANIGDSQLYSFEYNDLAGGHINSFHSTEHSATSSSEIQRVEGAGGKVYHSRVGGSLAVARSFGDFDLEKSNNPFNKNCQNNYPKKMIISAEPDINRLSLQSQNGKEVWWILASDGLWDMVRAEYIQEILNEIKKDHHNLPWEEKAELLMALLPYATVSRPKWIRRKCNGAPLPPTIYDEENAPKNDDYPHDDRSIIVFITNLDPSGQR